MQQAITEFGYLVAWADTRPGAAPDRDALREAVGRFLAAESWPIELIRKGKSQTRDARGFVRSTDLLPPDAGFPAALAMTIRSVDGASLNPLQILSSFPDNISKAPSPPRCVRSPLAVSSP